jgi:SAM-dependent methyltransferase
MNIQLRNSIKSDLDIFFLNQTDEAANQRTLKKQNLYFQTGNMNKLNFHKSYDAILFLDTLYYANDIQPLIKSCLAALNPNGRIFAYFSNWIIDVEYADNLKPENTELAKILNILGASYQFEDLTESGLQHWKKKWTVLEKMKETFKKEGNEALWQYRYREAIRYANWGDDKYTRYLYEISN